jgi:DNA-binding transcriptional regulator PaaX
MSNWQQYSALKNLINQYWELKDQEKYDEFIKKLTDILDV